MYSKCKDLLQVQVYIHLVLYYKRLCPSVCVCVTLPYLCPLIITSPVGVGQPFKLI